IFQRPITFAEAGPEVDDPGPAPAGVASAARETAFEGNARRLRQLRGSPQGDLFAGMEREEMTDMTVARLGLFIVFKPLLQLAVAPNPGRRQARARIGQRCPKRFVCLEHFGGAYA